MKTMEFKCPNCISKYGFVKCSEFIIVESARCGNCGSSMILTKPDIVDEMTATKEV